MTQMKAAVIYEAGGPEVLKIENRPVPIPKNGEVLIRVKAFGLNRSEMFTRQGHSPNVKFPRILRIEAAGSVAEAPSGEFRQGDVVLTAMGGMGRQFDGGYAEYTYIPAAQVQSIQTELPQTRRRPCSHSFKLPMKGLRPSRLEIEARWSVVRQRSNKFAKGANQCRNQTQA